MLILTSRPLLVKLVKSAQASPLACTVSGNDAFLLLSRSQGQDPLEMVVYRLTADSKWLLVRRVTTKRSGLANLVISDGTVFVRENDPTSTFGERIVVETAKITPPSAVDDLEALDGCYPAQVEEVFPSAALACAPACAAREMCLAVRDCPVAHVRLGDIAQSCGGSEDCPAREDRPR